MDFNFKRFLSHLLYPPLCIHCEALLPGRIPILCSTCLEQISLEGPEERCPMCFGRLHTHRCPYGSVPVKKRIAVSEPLGPAASLLRRLDQQDRSVIEPMASLMAYQWLAYQMPLPDLLIPLPAFFSHSFPTSLLLAQEIGRVLSVEVCSILRPQWDRDCFWTQGHFRSKWTLREKHKGKLWDRSLLLISARWEEEDLYASAELLQSCFPKAVFALSFSTM